MRALIFPTLALALCAGLAGCDEKRDTAAAEGEARSAAAEAPKAGDELPAAENRPIDPAVDPAAPVPPAETEAGGVADTGVATEIPPQSDVPPPSRAVFKDAECNFESWVGQKVNEEALKETGRPFRIMRPGDMMTMDHSPQRINVEHDENKIVTRVWCG